MNSQDTFFTFLDKSKFDTVKLRETIVKIRQQFSSNRNFSFFDPGTSKWCFEAKLDSQQLYVRIPWDITNNTEICWSTKITSSLRSGETARDVLTILTACPGAFELTETNGITDEKICHNGN